MPHSVPPVVLTHRLDIPSILRVLSVVVWLAWVQLGWCLIAEIRAAVRNAAAGPRCRWPAPPSRGSIGW